MQQAGGLSDLDYELDGLRSRRDALRQSATLPGAQVRQVMSAAFAELDAAIETAEKLRDGASAGLASTGGGASAGGASADPALPLAAAPKAAVSGPALLAAEAATAEAADGERRLLREMFQHAPVPLFLLERDGAIRRANRRAVQLIGAQPGSTAGRLLTAFVDLPARAAVATQLAAAARTGRQRHLRCRMLNPDGPFDAILTIAPLRTGGQQLLLAALGRDMRASVAGRTGAATAGTEPAGGDRAGLAGGELATAGVNGGVLLSRGAGVGRGSAPGTGGADAECEAARTDLAESESGEAVLDSEAARVVAAMTQRLDLVTAATRLLLDNATFSEAVTLRRCARLLASELAAWVIVDVERRQRLRRQVVIGPGDRESAGLARRLSGVHPGPATMQHQVHDSGAAALVVSAADAGLLGAGKDGVPLVRMLDATSLLCVPLSDGERTYGVLTLARRSGEEPFEAADLDLVEELGQQLGLAIRVDRMFRRRSEIADSLQASLLPSELPALPGVELAAMYVAATDAEGIEVGGDFYDVYPSPGGWGIAIGDVCGKGEEAAAVTAAARHAIRVLAHWNADPADVLSRANEVLQTAEFEGRFVTACASYLQWHEDRLRVRVGSAGHPAQLVIRAGGQVETLDGGGIALGLFPDAQMGAQDIELAAGDTLFLFSDGVTEARSPEMEYFEDRLPGELGRLAGRSAADVVSAMQALVLEFSQNELRDDVTMLVLRVGARQQLAPAAAGTAATEAAPPRRRGHRGGRRRAMRRPEA